MKIVFFGTSNVALPVLEALRQEHEILSVVTTPDAKVGRKQELQESPVSALATDLKLPLIKPEKVKDNLELHQQLQNLNADIFVGGGRAGGVRHRQGDRAVLAEVPITLFATKASQPILPTRPKLANLNGRLRIARIVL